MRTRLLGLLGAATEDVRLVLVVAPPGYGKTTLLEQWSQQDPRPFAWVSVDEADNDPVRLIGKVVLALHQVEPVDATVFRALSMRDVSLRSVLVPRLQRALAGRGPFVLVVDDLGEARDPAGVQSLLALAESLPPGSCLAMTARDRGVLPLGRLRTRLRALEVGVTQLAFDDAEAAELLGGAGADWPDAAVRELVRRTEGWPAAVYLASLVDRPPGAAAEAAGTQDYLADYLRDALLDRLSEATLRFLLRTSVLDELSGPLCDAVLGESGSAAKLADVIDRNLLVVPLDAHGEWYRYHRLFRQVLRSELRRREPDQERGLQVRAAQWFEQHGDPERAIAHALAAGDTSRAARLVTAHALDFLRSGRTVTVQGWLGAFSPADLTAYPPLGVAAAWFWALNGDPVQAQQALLAAERGDFPGVPPDGSASIASAIAMARAVLAPYGVERMLRDAQDAFSMEPTGSPWRPGAAVLLGCARLLNGLRAEAVWPLELAADQSRDAQAAAGALALAERALLAADNEDWPTAEACAAGAETFMRAVGPEGNGAGVLTHAAAARVAVHRGKLREARQMLGRALRLYSATPAFLPWVGAHASIVLGRIMLDLGDPEGAGARAEEARRQLGRLLTEGVLRSQLEALTKAALVHGDESAVGVPMSLSTAEMRVLQLLQTHMSLAEIAGELHVSRNTVKTQVSSIYRKLDVSSRSAALRQARSLGLVGW